MNLTEKQTQIATNELNGYIYVFSSICPGTWTPYVFNDNSISFFFYYYYY